MSAVQARDAWQVPASWDSGEHTDDLGYLEICVHCIDGSVEPQSGIPSHQLCKESSFGLQLSMDEQLEINSNSTRSKEGSCRGQMRNIDYHEDSTYQ